MSERRTQHAGLDGERWRQFSLPRQIIMIANEMNRARRFLEPAAPEHLKACYERTLRLIDLTVEANPARNLRRELLRLREVVAALYLADTPQPARHLSALRALLLLNREAAGQLAALSLSPENQRAW